MGRGSVSVTPAGAEVQGPHRKAPRSLPRDSPALRSGRGLRVRCGGAATDPRPGCGCLLPRGSPPGGGRSGEGGDSSEEPPPGSRAKAPQGASLRRCVSSRVSASPARLDPPLLPQPGRAVLASASSSCREKIQGKFLSPRSALRPEQRSPASPFGRPPPSQPETTCCVTSPWRSDSLPPLNPLRAARPGAAACPPDQLRAACLLPHSLARAPPLSPPRALFPLCLKRVLQGAGCAPSLSPQQR